VQLPKLNVVGSIPIARSSHLSDATEQFSFVEKNYYQGRAGVVTRSPPCAEISGHSRSPHDTMGISL
jgi:hypothetical protein